MLASGRPSRPPWLLFGGICFLWAILIHQLGAQWSVYDQYHYGWGVPLLMLYLLRERWKTRPATNPPLPALPASLLVVCGLLFWPTRIIHEASPIWRLTSWALGFEVIAITLGALWLAAGSKWARHFGFAIVFFLLAVPWPSPIENAVIQNLTRVNSGMVLAILHLWGTPAIQAGNLIELPNGIVGIEEACSGINSVQTSLMISCFLGELSALAWRRRILLILIGLGAAFFGNLVRTFTLVQICALSGTESLHRWHDSVGFAVLFITFGLVLAAWIFLRRHGIQAEATGDPGLPVFASVRPQWQYTFVISICVIELSCESWYRAHESQGGNLLRWSVSALANELPGDPAIMTRAQHELQYDEGRSVRWQDSDGSNWQVFDFEWYPSRNLASRVKVQLSQSHRPEICLPAAGMALSQTLGLHPRRTGPLRLPFRDFVFDSNGQRVFVYFCVWDQNTQLGLAVNFREDFSQRLSAALRGSRNYGERLLEIAIWGYHSKEEADQALESKLSKLITFPRG